MISIAVLSAALLLGACGSDNETSTGAGKAAQSTLQSTTTTTISSPAATTTSPTAPKSATLPSNNAPDSGISTRPGGPGGGGY
jgi:uncharacterized lipoprotein